MVKASKTTRTMVDPDSNIEKAIDLGFVGDPDKVDLTLLNQLIGSCQQRQCNKDQSSDLDFHTDLILTLGRFAYSVLSRTVAATVDFRWRAASR